MQLWEISARLQIRAAIELNFYCYDHDQMLEAYSVFTEDGILELPPGQRVRHGRADILERFSHREDGRLGPYGYVRHNLTNHHVVSLSPDAATSVSYYLVHSDERIVTGGVFYDQFVSVNDQWLISHRRIKQDFLNVEGATDA
jgi:hypothetical protein